MKLTKAQKAKLSADALWFAGSMFSMMRPGHGKLTFRMQESKPSPRSQAALNELVAAKLVTAEPFNQFGGVVYTPAVEFPRQVGIPVGAWPVTVPITRAALAATEGDGG
jgi:hypothetical protein